MLVSSVFTIACLLLRFVAVFTHLWAVQHYFYSILASFRRRKPST